MQGVTKPSLTPHTSRQSQQGVRKNTASLLGDMDTPRTGESLIKKQHISSLFTSVSMKSDNHPLSPNNRKQTKSEGNSSLHPGLAQPEKLDQRFASKEEISSGSNLMITGNSENVNTMEHSKSQSFQRKCKKEVSDHENIISDNIVDSNSCVDLLSKSSARKDAGTGALREEVNGAAGITQASYVDKNTPFCTRKSRKHLTDSAKILFTNIKTPKNRGMQSNESGSGFIPESQEDKSDNAFFPNRRKKKQKSTSSILEIDGKKFNDFSAQPVKGRKTGEGSIEKISGSLVSDIKVKTKQSKDHLTVNKLDCGGAVPTVITGAGTVQGGNLSLSYTPIRNDLVNDIASSTPVTLPEAQYSKSPALPLTPGSDVGSSVFNLMINSGLNDSSDLFNETDLHDIQGNPEDYKEIPEPSEDIQTKDNGRRSSEVACVNQKKQFYRREYQGTSKGFNRVNSDIKQNLKEMNNQNLLEIKKSNKVCISKCQRLKNLVSLEKNYDKQEIMDCKVTTHSSNVLDKKESFTKFSDLKSNESIHRESTEDFVLTESQKNGLMMTMNSQDSGCSLSPSHHQRELDVFKESGYSDCSEKSLECHKKLENKPKMEDNLQENFNGSKISETDKKRKLQLDADLPVPTKRMCAMHDKSLNQVNCDKNVKEPSDHVTPKMDFMRISMRKAQEMDEDFQNLTYLEKLTDLSELSLNESNSNMEGKEIVDDSPSVNTKKVDILNQAFEDLTELANESSSSLLSRGDDESPCGRSSFQKDNKVSDHKKSDIGSTPNDFSVSDSFLDQVFESWPQDEQGPQNIIQQPIGQDSQPLCDESSVLLSPNQSGKPKKKREKKINMIQPPQNDRNFLNCTTEEYKPHLRGEPTIKPGRTSIGTSNKSDSGDIFSQLEITARTEALLEGTPGRNNTYQERLFVDPVCSFPERQENQENGIAKRESSGKSAEKMSYKNITSLSEEAVMPVPITNNKVAEKGNNWLLCKTLKKHIVDDFEDTKSKTVIAPGKSGCSISQVKDKVMRNMQEQQQIANVTSSLSSTLNSSLPNTSSFCIIDVVNDSQVFSSFVEELKHQAVVSVALACERAPSQKQKQEQGIGKAFSTLYFYHI